MPLRDSMPSLHFPMARTTPSRLLLLLLSLPLAHPLSVGGAGHPGRAGAPPAALAASEGLPAAAAPAGRRSFLLQGASAAAAALALGAAPRGASASYALYMASQESYNERKRTNYVPVATSDKESLREIQATITSRQTPSVRARAAAKKPQYCAGQTASVTPMLENICEDIGMSKADQSNTRQDAFGNMAIGVSTEVDINKYKGGGRDVSLAADLERRLSAEPRARR